MPSNILNAYLGSAPLQTIYVGDKKVYPNEQPFHARFDLSKGTSSTTLTLPFANDSSYANLKIDWGDGVTTTGTNTHTYPSIGVYDVKVYGEMRDFRYNNTNQPQKLMRIINWGEFVISQNSVFYGCSNLVIDDLTNIPLVTTTNMYSMFFGCANLTAIPKFDTSNVTSMIYAFNVCSSLTTIPLLDTSKVINMNSMFYNCTNLTTIPLLDTSNVTNMDYMFRGCAKLTSIPSLNTSNVTAMQYMFQNCSNLTTIPLLDTSKVTNMGAMFQNCTILNVDLSELCVPLITSLPSNFVTNAPLMTTEKLPVWGTCPNGENLLP